LALEGQSGLNLKRVSTPGVARGEFDTSASKRRRTHRLLCVALGQTHPIKSAQTMGWHPIQQLTRWNGLPYQKVSMSMESIGFLVRIYSA
jgi:hypothetical protein